jgi:ATP-dependent DNA helicase RecG
MAISSEDIVKLIDGGETDRVEFKESLANVDGIARAVCAQANNLAGADSSGYVLVGVANDKGLVGIAADDNEQQRLAQVRLDGRIVPTPNMTITIVEVEGRKIAVLAVAPSSSPPVRLGGIAYVRIGTATGKATPDEERQLTQQRVGIQLPFDARGVAGTSLEDLDLPRFQLEYLPQAIAPEVLAENGRPVSQQLASLKLSDPAGVATPTGLLAIGKNPTNWLPSAYIQFRRVAGIGITDDTLDQTEYRGTIADMVRALEEKLNAHNLASLSIGNGKHEIQSQFPMSAIEQLLRNAIMHRDYEVITPIRVTWFLDRIQIDNPGGPFGISPANFGQPGYTSYRNPNIAELMKSTGLVERFGVGIAIARRALEDAGHPPLELKTEGNFTFCVLRSRQ